MDDNDSRSNHNNTGSSNSDEDRKDDVAATASDSSTGENLIEILTNIEEAIDVFFSSTILGEEEQGEEGEIKEDREGEEEAEKEEEEDTNTVTTFGTGKHSVLLIQEKRQLLCSVLGSAKSMAQSIDNELQNATKEIVYLKENYGIVNLQLQTAREEITITQTTLNEQLDALQKKLNLKETTFKTLASTTREQMKESKKESEILKDVLTKTMEQITNVLQPKIVQQNATICKLQNEIRVLRTIRDM